MNKIRQKATPMLCYIRYNGAGAAFVFLVFREIPTCAGTFRGYYRRIYYFNLARRLLI